MVGQWNKGIGWRESLETGVREQQKAKQEDAAREKMHRLAEVEFYSFDQFQSDLEMGLDELEAGMTRMQKARLFADRMSGGTTAKHIDQQKAEAELKIRILNELTPHEKRKPKLLHKKARQAIADKLEITRTDVDELVFAYQMNYAQWSYLRREFLRGRRLPNTNEEFEWMLQSRPTKEYMYVMRKFFKYKERLEAEKNGETLKTMTFWEKMVGGKLAQRFKKPEDGWKS